MSRAACVRRFGLVLCALIARNSLALDVTVLDQDGRPVADAVVFTRPTGSEAASVAGTAIIDQIDKTFVPRVSAIAVGTTVTFPNKDNIKHHVYSFSPPKVFQLKLYHGLAAQPVTFDEPGLVVLGCNIHDGMIAYVYVVDTPHFALSDTNGIARLASLAPGPHELDAWHFQMSEGPDAGSPASLTVAAETSATTLSLALRPELPLPPPLE